MITTQDGALPIAILAVVFCVCFLVTLLIYCRDAFINKKKEKTLTKDMTKVGIVFSVCILFFIICYGAIYYEHFQSMIKENKNFHETLYSEHTDSGKVNVYDWYENKLNKLTGEGKINSLERDIMYNDSWLSLDHIPLRYIFPFKSHNRLMFFSLYFTIVAGCLFAIYIKPTKSAFEKNHPQKNTVLWLNILTGWTIIGWLALLMWMNPGSEQSKTVSQSSPEQQNPSATDKLLQLKALRDADAITQEEYEQKKQELLNQI